MSDCCKFNENLSFVMSPVGAVGICQKCGRKHYRMRANPKDERPLEEWLEKTVAEKQFVAGERLAWHKRMWKKLKGGK